MDSSTDDFSGDPRTNRERMLAGDLHIADDPESARRAQRAMQLAHAYHQAAIAETASLAPAPSSPVTSRPTWSQSATQRASSARSEQLP
jgi:hypothetical protein